MMEVSTHPAHLVDNQGRINPSAFIPFCDLGGNMSVMGTSIPQFELPVCSSFKPHVVRSRLCYQLDVNTLREKIDAGMARKTGLILALDYNKERSLSEDDEPGNLLEESNELLNSVDQYFYPDIDFLSKVLPNYHHLKKPARKQQTSAANRNTHQ